MTGFTSQRPRSFDQQQRVQDALRDREQVIWIGRPVRGALSLSHKLPGLFGSLLMGLLVFHFLVSPSSPLKNPEDPDRFGTIIGLLITMAMASLLIRIPWRKMKRLQHTLYLLTNQRVAILDPRKNRRDTSMPLTGIGRVDCLRKNKRYGTLLLLPQDHHRATPNGPGRRTPLRPVALRFLSHAEDVAQQIEEQQKRTIS